MRRVVKPRRLPAPGFPSFVVLVVAGLVLVSRGTTFTVVSAGVLMAAGTCCLRPTGSRS